MRFIIFLAAALASLPMTRASAETSHLAFVTEYVRELGTNERMRELGEKDIAEQGSAKFSAIIRSSTRIILELNSQIAMMKGVTLNPPFDTTPGLIVGFYDQKIEIHRKLIAMATAFVSDPKPGVDYGAMAADTPKLTAMNEYIDRSLFQAAPLIFASLLSDKPDSQGHMSRLRITRAERDRLLRSLQIDFGDKMDRANQNYTVSSATVLRDFLSKQGFKCSDDPL